jgi:hypothetical protein
MTPSPWWVTTPKDLATAMLGPNTSLNAAPGLGVMHALISAAEGYRRPKIIDYSSGNPVDANDPNGQGADVYVYRMQDKKKGYAFFAVDGRGSAPVEGCFNNSTFMNLNGVPAGDYSLSPRPHIEVKQGLEGLEQRVGLLRSGNSSGDPNKHEGCPTLSNTDDWNTIITPGGDMMQGVMIHPGSEDDGSGGNSLGCLVANKHDYESLNNMLQANYNKGGVRLHSMP